MSRVVVGCMFAVLIGMAIGPRMAASGPPATLNGPNRPGYELPKDAKAPVIVFNYRGGYAPPKISDLPTLSIFPDGTVEIPAKFQGSKAYRGKLTSKELQDLLHYVIGTQQYFEYDQAKVANKIQDEKDRIAAAGGAIRRMADSPTVEIRVHANGKTVESSYYPTGIDESGIAELQRRAAVEKRLKQVMATVQIGGREEVARWLTMANAALLAQHPDAAPLATEDFQSGSERADGNKYISFNRSEVGADGRPVPNHLTAVTINQPAQGEAKINVICRVIASAPPAERGDVKPPKNASVIELIGTFDDTPVGADPKRPYYRVVIDEVVVDPNGLFAKPTPKKREQLLQLMDDDVKLPKKGQTRLFVKPPDLTDGGRWLLIKGIEIK